MAATAADASSQEVFNLRPRITPAGAVHVGGGAFERGLGHGLLDLGAREVDRTLEPGLAFLRDLGRLYVTKLCGLPDLEETKRAKLTVPAPEEELAQLAQAVPPMEGAEYVDAARLAAWWGEIDEAAREELGAHEGTIASWLAARNEAWSLVGKVCFHLAENRADEAHPFAFLATYTTKMSAKSKPTHVPLRHAWQESQKRGDRGALLSLLVPVERAARSSPLVAELLQSGELYEARVWTPVEAHRFLKEIEHLESAGVLVRVPDWWRGRRPPAPEVNVKVGGSAPAAGTVGAESLLDFEVSVTLDGEPLSRADLEALLAAGDGLVALRGRWIEVDRARLRELLAHWKKVQAEARGGMSFLEGMRLLAGARVDASAAEQAAPSARVVAGPWLEQTLAGLRQPQALAAEAAAPSLRAELRPYQAVGVRWLRFATQLGLGVCLADDMGLGKTLQVLGLFLLDRARGAPPHLLVVPASLLGNWQAEAARFAPELRLRVIHPSGDGVAEDDLAGVDVAITTYGLAGRLAWLAARKWSLVVLDEAQAIKNAGSRQTRAVKALQGRARVALTGTPVENRLGDLWSLFDFLDPGLLGTPKQFTAFAKRLAEADAGYAPLRRLVSPYLLRRLKTDRQVVADLPDKTEVVAYCGLAPKQAALYQKSVDELRAKLKGGVDGIERRGVVLAFLMRFKQICNHPAHWLGAGAWTEEDSGKLGRLREIAETIAAKQEKALVFSQFREATGPLAQFLADIFGRPGLILTGETPVRERAALVKQFQESDEAPFFVLSLKAGGVGLNLTAASHVVHFDRWWNPAVEDQATDRAYRIGQHRNVLVHKLTCRGTVEEKIDAMIAAKQGLARDLLGGGGEQLLTELGDAELLDLVALDLRRAQAEN